MTKLPVCSGEATIRVFKKAGWIQDRQRGSHVTLIKEGMAIVLTISTSRVRTRYTSQLNLKSGIER